MTVLALARPWFFSLLAIAGLVSAALAQEAAPAKLNLQDLGIPGLGGFGGAANPATLSASFDVQKGSRRGRLHVTALMQPDWHIYSITQPDGGPMRTRIKVADAPEFKVLGPFQADSPPHVRFPGDENPFPVSAEEHGDQVTWTAPIELTAGTQPESLEIAVNVSGQVCKEACLPLSEKLVATFEDYTAAPETPGEYRPDPKQAEVVFTGHIEPAQVAPGGKAKLVLTATPTNGWHIYAYAPTDPDKVGANKPTLIALNKLPGWTVSPLATSVEPKTKAAAKAGMPDERYHDEPVTWSIDLSVPADSPEGEHVLTGYIGFQTCKKGCLPPQAVQFRVGIPVASSTVDGKLPLEFIPVKRSSPPVPGEVTGYKDVAALAKANPLPTGKVDYAGLLPIVGFGLLGGLILNLMPCVLPVIGLKVLSFAQQGGQSRAKVFALNAWFAGGLLLVFLLLATAAAFGSFFFGENLAWGQQFTYTWFKVAMVVIVFAFALSFLGVWEVPIPGFAQSSASGKLQRQEGPSGAFFKGIFTTLLATPCSGPFLGPVFAYTLAQPPIVTYLIFASVGVGMASPYLVIGAFPALVKWLPKPGEWMETFKQLMGFVLLGTVVYLFATISADWFIPTLALVMATWLACWIIGKVPVYESVGKQLRAWGLGVATAAAIGWGAFTFLGPVKHLYEWEAYSPDTIAKLQAEGKTVMIDFTADWCPTCQTNFMFAINTQGVKEVVEKNGVAPVLADWSDHNDTIKLKLAELNSNSIPLLAIYPAGKPGEVIVLRDMVTESQVIAALEQAGASKDAASNQQVAAAHKQ